MNDTTPAALPEDEQITVTQLLSAIGSQNTTNPFYLCYCMANRRTEREQREHDREECPGGEMANFVIWIGAQKIVYRQQHPEAFLGDAIRSLIKWRVFLAERAVLQHNFPDQIS